MQECLTEAEVRGNGVLGCRRCILREDLCHHVKELQEEVYRLHSIRDKKRSLLKSPRPCSCKSLNSNCMKGGASRAIHLGDIHDSEGCRLLTSGIR